MNKLINEKSTVPLASIPNIEDIATIKHLSETVINPYCEDEAEIQALISLLQSVKPQDLTEAVLASQFMLLHLKGFKVLEQNYANSKNHSMAMIRLSHQALNMLQRYRGKSQSININYNILSKCSL